MGCDFVGRRPRVWGSVEYRLFYFSMGLHSQFFYLPVGCAFSILIRACIYPAGQKPPRFSLDEAG